MFITLIACVDENYGIGRNNELLVTLKEDMRWFRAQTLHKPVIMGRTTYESIGHPLKGRTNVVLTRDEKYKPNHDGILVRHSIAEVLAEFVNERELMVIGGQQIYEQFLPFANRICLTELQATFEADAFFPRFDKSEFKCFYRKEGDDVVPVKYSFSVYKKVDD